MVKKFSKKQNSKSKPPYFTSTSLFFSGRYSYSRDSTDDDSMWRQSRSNGLPLNVCRGLTHGSSSPRSLTDSNGSRTPDSFVSDDQEDSYSYPYSAYADSCYEKNYDDDAYVCNNDFITSSSSSIFLTSRKSSPLANSNETLESPRRRHSVMPMGLLNRIIATQQEREAADGYQVDKSEDSDENNVDGLYTDERSASEGGILSYHFLLIYTDHIFFHPACIFIEF